MTHMQEIVGVSYLTGLLTRSVGFVWFAIILMLTVALAGCATAPADSSANNWYPGLDNPNISPEQKMELIQTYNNDWAAERQREQQIWQRMTVPPPVYVVRPW